jgi:hypothetical protein
VRTPLRTASTSQQQNKTRQKTSLRGEVNRDCAMSGGSTPRYSSDVENPSEMAGAIANSTARGAQHPRRMPFLRRFVLARTFDRIEFDVLTKVHTHTHPHTQ